MNANEKRVKMLASKLPNRDGQAIDRGPLVQDEEWTAHHANMWTVSECIEDYQVIRHYDIEIDYCDCPLDRMNAEEEARRDVIDSKYDAMIDALESIRKPISAEYADQSTEWYRDMLAIDEAAEKAAKDKEREIECQREDEIMELEQDIIDRFYAEGLDPWHDYEAGEFMQEWVNVKTGEVVVLGKICKDRPQYCDYDKKTWSIMRPEANKTHKTFVDRFINDLGDGHYRDITIHPVLMELGYDGLQCDDWCKSNGYYETNKESDFLLEVIKTTTMGNLMASLVSQGMYSCQYESVIKLYGLHTMMKLSGKDDDYKAKYLAARKIARRNHYHIEDINVWDDMVDGLIKLGKDVHNAKFVCPANLKEAYDNVEMMLASEQERRTRKAYEKKVKPYLPIRLQNSHITIAVCPSVPQMKRDALYFNNCAYNNKYYAKDDTLILIVHNKKGDPVSMIEYNTKTETIMQNRGHHNAKPKYYAESCNLLNRNKHVFRNTNVVPLYPKQQPLTQAA